MNSLEQIERSENFKARTSSIYRASMIMHNYFFNFLSYYHRGWSIRMIETEQAYRVSSHIQVDDEKTIASQWIKAINDRRHTLDVDDFLPPCRNDSSVGRRSSKYISQIEVDSIDDGRVAYLPPYELIACSLMTHSLLDPDYQNEIALDHPDAILRDRNKTLSSLIMMDQVGGKYSWIQELIPRTNLIDLSAYNANNRKSI